MSFAKTSGGKPVRGEKKSPEEKLSKEALLAGVAQLSREERSDVIDELMEKYCSCCAHALDSEGNCPDGCDPDEMLNDGEDEDEDEEGEEREEDDDDYDTGDPDDDEEEDDATEEEPS
jgi:hypothetical protein